MSEKILKVNTNTKSYSIIIKRNALSQLNSYLDLDRKVLIVTDQNIPKQYCELVSKQCKYSVIKTITPGEESKSLKSFEELQLCMLEHNFTRKDAVVAIGGGVVGDLSAFAASCYMRGISFYNLPTSLLSQVDSSVGGKTAVNIGGIKNIVGTFYQPEMVIIDPETLKTLPEREFSSGMAEVIKMAVSLDKDFFEYLKQADFCTEIDNIIARAIENKIKIVSQDEKEAGLRKVLNFGHTIGHGIEVTTNLTHGESIGIGMLPMSSQEVRSEIVALLKKAGLPTKCKIDLQRILDAMVHDKKSEDGAINAVTVDKPGIFEFKRLSIHELENIITEVL